MPRKTKTTTTDPLKTFTDRIERLAQRNPIRSSAKAIIDDIVQLQFNLLSGLLPLVYALGGAAWFADRHLIALDEYRDHPEVWADLVELAVEYQNLVAASEPFTDLLSNVYGVAIPPKQAKTMAQHMSPPSVGDIALWFLPGNSGPRRVGDPTCGSGALMLAYLRQRLEKDGKAALASTYVVGNDIDPAMMKLATVQIALSSLAHDLPLGSLTMYRADIIKDYQTAGNLAVAIVPDIKQTLDHGHEDDVLAAVQAHASVEPSPEDKHLMALVYALAVLTATDEKTNGAAKATRS